jgi:hypothetical protein
MHNAQASRQGKSVSAQNDYPNLIKVLDGFFSSTQAPDDRQLSIVNRQLALASCTTTYLSM